MNIFRRLGFVCVVIFSMASCSNVVEGNAIGVDQSIDSLNIAGLKQPSKNVLSSGQPSPLHFDALAAAGVAHIINLRPESEVDWDEASAVKQAGMTYHHIPVAGAAGITKENAERMGVLLSSLSDERVLVHCGSGNRVGALTALYEAQSKGLDTDSAIEEGKKWGLTGLESPVRNYLKGIE